MMKEESSASIERDQSNSSRYASMDGNNNVEVDGGAFDVVLDIVSKLAMVGKISQQDEDLLVDAALMQDRRIGKLIKHYVLDPDRFVRHAIRTLSETLHLLLQPLFRSQNMSKQMP